MGEGRFSDSERLCTWRVKQREQESGKSLRLIRYFFVSWVSREGKDGGREGLLFVVPLN